MNDRNHTAYRKGDRLFKRGQWVGAVAQFEIALLERPDDWQAMWALGNCYAELKKPRKAAQQFELALTLAENDALPGLHFNLGNALFDQGQYEAAIEQYRRVPKGHHVARSAANNLALAEGRLCGGS